MTEGSEVPLLHFLHALASNLLFSKNRSLVLLLYYVKKLFILKMGVQCIRKVSPTCEYSCRYLTICDVYLMIQCNTQEKHYVS